MTLIHFSSTSNIGDLQSTKSLFLPSKKFSLFFKNGVVVRYSKYRHFYTGCITKKNNYSIARVTLNVGDNSIFMPRILRQNTLYPSHVKNLLVSPIKFSGKINFVEFNHRLKFYGNRCSINGALEEIFFLQPTHIFSMTV